MNVLFGVSEVASIYHLGGLGDVAYSLPKALKEIGVDIRVALPFHNSIKSDPSWRIYETFILPYNQNQEKVEIWEGLIPNTRVPLYLFANPTYLTLASGVADDAIEKFSFFSAAIAYWVTHTSLSWKPELIHCNDWHTALVPVLLKHNYGEQQIKTLLSIHNLNFQGLAADGIIQKLNIDPKACSILQWDGQNRDINLLMEGIIHSEWVNAVSPTYANEILTPEYGAYLDAVTGSLSGKISGILNGIDYEVWNPETDAYINTTFTLTSLTEGKAKNKEALQQELALPVNTDTVLSGYIGRVDPNQKGIQLLIEAMVQGVLGTEKYPFIFLGVGDRNLENQLKDISDHNPFVKVICRFEPELSHRIYAGCDCIIMPSKYEPCGLVQMIAMRYAAIPVVRRTGGLADSVSDNQTGFIFENYSSEDLISCLGKALPQLLPGSTLDQLRLNCTKTDFSWSRSAHMYNQLYHQIMWL